MILKIQRVFESTVYKAHMCSIEGFIAISSCFHLANLPMSQKKEEGKPESTVRSCCPHPGRSPAPRIWSRRNHKTLNLWTGRLLSLLSILELLRQGCSTGAEGRLAGVEFSHLDLSKDGCKSYKMSRNTNRHSLNRLGGVSNKKWKLEWKENFISNPPCGTWLFQHIWFAKFPNVWWLSRKSELIKDISTLSSFPRLCSHPTDNREDTTNCLIAVAASTGKRSREKDGAPSVWLQFRALLPLTVSPWHVTLPFHTSVSSSVTLE